MKINDTQVTSMDGALPSVCTSETFLQDRNVMLLDRPYRCNNCICCPCINQTLSVECPPGVKVGSISQNTTMTTPSFDVRDAEDDILYKIEGKYMIAMARLR